MHFLSLIKQAGKKKTYFLFWKLMKGSETDFELREGIFDQLFSVWVAVNIIKAWK